MAKTQSKIRDKILKKYNIDIDSENIILSINTVE